MNQSITQPDKADIIRKIEANAPIEILRDNIWIAYYFSQKPDGTFTKPPCTNKGYTVKNGTPGATFKQACTDGFPGIKLNSDNNFIAFDIDDKLAKEGKRKFSIELLSKEFREFLDRYPTYTEYSPSGCGLRVLAKCSDKKELLKLNGRLFLDQERCLGGELFTHSGFVTITGNCVKNPHILATLGTQEILMWRKLDKGGTDNRNAENLEYGTNILKVLSLSQFSEVLDICKLDQSEKVKQAYTSITGDDYNHYNYWIMILAASHDYASRTGKFNEVTEEILKWSSTDVTSFTGTEDVLKHFESFGMKDSQITYKTLFKFWKLLKFEWPKPLIKKNIDTGKPLINEVKNFIYMLNYHNIEFKLDLYSDQFYVKANESIIRSYFKPSSVKKPLFGMIGPYDVDEMTYKMWAIAQDNGYDNAAYGTVFPLFKAAFFERKATINLLATWLNTEPEDLPDDIREPNTDIKCSNLDYLMSCIEFQDGQDLTLAREYMNTFFFEMMMPIFNVRNYLADRSFMLVFTGEQGSRKSTFFKWLMPEFFRDRFIINPAENGKSDKSFRDIRTFLLKGCLVILDEFDQFYATETEAAFKRIVTDPTVEGIPIFSKTVTKMPKQAVLAGTTNKDRFPFSQDENRRFALIRTKWCHTEKMEKINWHHFYRYFVKEGSQSILKGLTPWKPTDSMKASQAKANEQMRAKTNLEEMLLSVFEFETSDGEIAEPFDLFTIKSVQTDKRLMGSREIEGILMQNYPKHKINPSELRRVLERLCGRYTKSTNRKIELPNTNGILGNGIVSQKKYNKYVMPPRKVEIFN